MPFIRAIGAKGKHDASCRALATRKLARSVHVQRAWYPVYIEASMFVLFAKLQLIRWQFEQVFCLLAEFDSFTVKLFVASSEPAFPP
jgi:hypothetical protein